MKGKPLSKEQIDQAERAYQSGLTYSEIEDSVGVSRASTSARVTEKASTDLDYVAAHDIARHCRLKNTNIKALQNRLEFFEEWEKWGFSLQFLGQVVFPFLKETAVHNKDPSKILKQAADYFGILETTKMSPTELDADLRNKVKTLSAVRKETSEAEEKLFTLQSKIHSAESKLTNLSKLEKIQSQLKKLHKSEEDAGLVMSTAEKISERGLTLESMDALSMEFERSGINTLKACKEIATLRNEFGSLGNAVESKRRALSSLTNEVCRKEEEKSLNEHKVGQLREQIKSLAEKLEQLSLERLSSSSDYKIQMENNAKQIELQKSELRILSVKVESTRIEEYSKRAKINGAKILWDFVLSKAEALPQGFSLTGTIRPSSIERPLPDDVRRVFRRALVTLCMNDEFARIRECEDYRKHRENEGRRVVRAIWQVRDGLESEINLMKQLVSTPPIQSEELHNWALRIVSNPIFVKLILSLPRDTVVETYSLLSTTEREMFIEIIHSSESLADRLEEERFNRYFEAQIQRMISQAMRGMSPSIGPAPFEQSFNTL